MYIEYEVAQVILFQQLRSNIPPLLVHNKYVQRRRRGDVVKELCVTVSVLPILTTILSLNKNFYYYLYLKCTNISVTSYNRRIKLCQTGSHSAFMLAKSTFIKTKRGSTQDLHFTCIYDYMKFLFIET